MASCAEVGPRVSLNANACAAFDAEEKRIGTDFNLFEQHELVVELGGRVQVPGLGIGKDFPFDTGSHGKSQANYYVGDVKMCPVGGS